MRRCVRAIRPSFLIAPLAFAIQCVPVHADDAGLELEEIVVTAQRRAESILEVPISMAVETGVTLEKKGIATLEGLSLQTPSLITQDGGRVSSVAMRGLGSPGLDTVESSVGIYIDEVYFGRSRLSRNPMFDMDRIEVLRGPQGTLYGRNTIAGAISMYTARPSDEFSARVLGEYGNIDSHKVEGYVSGPITDTLSGRIAGINSERGTYLDNSIGPDGGGQDSEGYRLSVGWTPAETVYVFAKYEHMTHENIGMYDQLVGDPFGVWADYPGIDLKQDDKQQVNGPGLQGLNEPGGRYDADIAALHVNWDLPGDYALKSVTGWSEYDARSRDWISASPDNALTINGLTERNEYYSQELRIESPTDRRFHFVAGGFVDSFDVHTLPRAEDFAALNLGTQILPPLVDGLATNPQLGFLGDLQDNVAQGYANGTAEYFRLITPSGSPDGRISNLDQEITTWSLFLEGEYEFTEQWHLILGVRYTDEENEFALSKGTWYTNGVGLPWGAYPSANEIAASALAADPSLAPWAALLPVIYGATSSAQARPGYTVSQLPTYIAAPGGTPRAEDRLEDDQWIPTAKLQYFLDDDTMLYFTVASGFKAGGVNSGNINVYTREGDTFGAEEALSFELGGKFTLLDGAAQLNVALFRTDFDDLQTATITPQGAVTVVNAAAAVTQGVDLDATWRLSETVTVGGAYSWLDAYYDDSEELNCGSYMTNVRAAAGEDFSTTPCTYRLDDMPNGDDALQRAPEHTVTLWGEYFAPVADGWDLQLYGSVNYRDESSTTLDNYFYADDLTMVGARVALHDTRRKWSVALFGNNLLDEDGLVLHQENSAGAIKGMITTPRTYGLQLVKEW